MLITYAILIRDCVIWLFVISRVTQRTTATVRLVKMQETDTITLLATFSWFLGDSLETLGASGNAGRNAMARRKYRKWLWFCF